MHRNLDIKRVRLHQRFGVLPIQGMVLEGESDQSTECGDEKGTKEMLIHPSKALGEGSDNISSFGCNEIGSEARNGKSNRDPN